MEKDPKELKTNNDQLLQNFIGLCETYGYDKSKYSLLLDSRECPTGFLRYLRENHFSYIDYGQMLARADKPVILGYDWHWNDYGRHLIAQQIVEELLWGFREN